MSGHPFLLLLPSSLGAVQSSSQVSFLSISLPLILLISSISIIIYFFFLCLLYIASPQIIIIWVLFWKRLRNGDEMDRGLKGGKERIGKGIINFTLKQDFANNSNSTHSIFPLHFTTSLRTNVMVRERETLTRTYWGGLQSKGRQLPGPWKEGRRKEPGLTGTQQMLLPVTKCTQRERCVSVHWLLCRREREREELAKSDHSEVRVYIQQVVKNEKACVVKLR